MIGDVISGSEGSLQDFCPNTLSLSSFHNSRLDTLTNLSLCHKAIFREENDVMRWISLQNSTPASVTNPT
jgi:hypothetical protein